MEEGEINSSLIRPTKEKGVGNQDDFTLVVGKKWELVYVRYKGKSVDVTMSNSFGNLMELGKGDKWALSIVEGSALPLQVDDTTMVLRGMCSDGNLAGTKASNSSHD